jgi:hypothetical protein
MGDQSLLKQQMRLSNEKAYLYSFIGIGMELWLCVPPGQMG